MKRKVGKQIRKTYIGHTSYEMYIPDSKNFKSLQITIGGWVKVCDEYEQRDYDKIISRTKHRIKSMLRMWARTNGYKEETIIDISLPKVPTGNTKTRKHQFLRIDICLFNENIEYDREYCEIVTENLVHRIIDVLNEFPDAWTFVENRKKRNVQV